MNIRNLRYRLPSVFTLLALSWLTLLAPLTPAAAAATNTIPFKEVPLSLQRRAVQLLEEARASEDASAWAQAWFKPEVRVLYRPAMEDIAYYEFSVAIFDEYKAAQRALGFIVLSTGEHDLPVAHWSQSGASPTEQLIRQAAEQGGKTEELVFYKIDTLTYAAEDSRGQLVATVNTLPARVVGMDPAMLDEVIEPSSSEWIPDYSPKHDDDAGEVDGVLVSDGPDQLPIELSGWESWDELKQQYNDSYGVLIEQLRRSAGAEWEIQTALATLGEALTPGMVYPLALLDDIDKIDIEGAAIAYVTTVLVERDGLPPLLQITVADVVPEKVLPLDVYVTYIDGVSEHIPFTVAPALPPDDEQDDTAPAAKAYSTSSALWTYYSAAGLHNAQRDYDQIDANTWPNTSNCYSGCGATAWAMLFGWADNQAASGNAYWAPRTGLYRQYGGYGADAVAPKYMDYGVNNMTWELRGRIGTFCWFGSGATAPWDMDQAAGYLVGRTGTRLKTDFSYVGYSWSKFGNKARKQIREHGTPAIIGTGWFSHYPLAYRYRTRTTQVCHTNGQRPWEQLCTNVRSYQFYVNQGWGGDGNGWVGGSTWFVGEITPH